MNKKDVDLLAEAYEGVLIAQSLANIIMLMFTGAAFGAAMSAGRVPFSKVDRKRERLAKKYVKRWSKDPEFQRIIQRVKEVKGRASTPDAKQIRQELRDYIAANIKEKDVAGKAYIRSIQ